MRKSFKKAIALLVPLVFISGISYSPSKEEEPIVSEGEIQIEAGKKQVQNVVASMPSGEQISFPLAIVKGESPGPTLGIIAGADGGEYCGIEAALRIYSLLEPSKLKGEVRIVPVANIPGFMSRTMFVVPQDGKTIRYPGKIDGSYSERLSALLYRQIMEPSDCVVELHGGELVEAMVPYVRVMLTTDKKYNAKAKKIADVFGVRNVILAKARGTADKSGSDKLRIVAGAGSNGLRAEEDVNSLTTGILNIAGYLNMIERQPTLPKERIYMDRFVGVFSPCEGIFDYKVNMGDEVEKGSVLGVIRDYGGKVIAEIYAPEDGVILGIVTSYGVRKGSELIGIGPKI